MKVPGWLRLFVSASRRFGRFADGLERLNRNLERRLAADGIPELPIAADVDAHVHERSMPPSVEEWEAAIAEELQRRAEAENREIR